MSKTTPRSGTALPLVALRWLGARLLHFAAIVAFVVPVVFLRAGTITHQGALPDFHWNRYWPALLQYVNHLLHGSFGPIYQEPPLKGGAPVPIPTNESIGLLIRLDLPNTLVLFVISLLLGLTGGILMGMLASRFSRRRVRTTASTLNLVGLAFPDLVLTVLVMFGFSLVTSYTGLIILPQYGTWDGHMTVQHMILPVLLLAVFPGAYAARLSAAAFDTVFEEDYIRTAKAKGVVERRLRWAHAFRNALIPIVAGIPTISGILISNQIILEYLMNILGVGRLLAWELVSGVMIKSTTTVYPSPNLIASIAIVLAALFVVIDSVVDLVQLWIDPVGRQARFQERSQQEMARETRSATSRRKTRSKPLLGSTGRMTGGQELALADRLAALPAALKNRAKSLPDAARKVGQAYRGNLPLILGSLIVLGLITVALFARQLMPHDPFESTFIIMKNSKDWLTPPFAPSDRFPLGSDALGRDLLSQIIYGARYTLLIPALVVPLRMLVALPLGLAAGWLRGFWERLVRSLSSILGAIPSLIIPGILAPAIFPPPEAGTRLNPNVAAPPNPLHVLLLNVAVLVVIGWPRMAESTRLMTRSLATRPFVEGARAVGANGPRIMFRHILPHFRTLLPVQMAAEVSWVMMLMIQLGVFGIWLGGATAWEGGLMVPRYPDWSQLVSRSTKYLWTGQEWVLVVPVVAFFIALLGFNLLAEGIRKANLRNGGSF